MPDAALADNARAVLGPGAERARGLLRACVRCGMCSAVCPTYAVTGDELDSPRGRIHLVRDILETGAASSAAVRHLDRCLTCRACETACPSGVQYAELADIGREFVEKQNRPFPSAVPRAAVAAFFGNPAAVRVAANVARKVAPLLPGGMRETISAKPFSPNNPGEVNGDSDSCLQTQSRSETESRLNSESQPESESRSGSDPDSASDSVSVKTKPPRKIVALRGCVEGDFAPGGLRALETVAAAVGAQVVVPAKARCCGALRLHLGKRDDGKQDAAATVRAWRDEFENGAECAVMTSSGCEAVAREWPKVFADANDENKNAAQQVAPKIMNAAEFVEREWDVLSQKLTPSPGERVAFHAPCTLRNVVRMSDRVGNILIRAGFELTPVPDAHMCCGSAGTYSLLQPKMARELRARKLQALRAGKPSRIVTANVGCQMFLSAKAPVAHWLELLAERLR